MQEQGTRDKSALLHSKNTWEQPTSLCISHAVVVVSAQ